MVLDRNWLRIVLLASAFFGIAVFASSVVHAATLVVINNDGPGEGFNDPTARAPVGGNTGTTLGAQRLIAFQRAADIWGGLLSSPVTIRIGATFDPLTCSATSAILGSAGPTNAFRDFSGAPVGSTYYPVALANALNGSDLDPGVDDITARFNSAIGTTCAFASVWYYGLDANPPSGQIDFVSVVLHELGHGLGFLTFVDLASGAKLLGYNDTFMLNLEDHGASPADYPSMTNSQRVTASKDTGNLHWVGAKVRAASGVLTAGKVGDHVRMYAPNPQVSLSSVSHWDTALTPDQIMEPSYTVPLHNPVLELPLFQDIGWTLLVTVPGAPTIGTATAGNAQATVSFTPPMNNGGSAITSYTVTSSPGGITRTGTASPITVTGLTNGTSYTFTVTATNSVGTGPASAPSNSVTPSAAVTPPSPPTLTGATASDTSATLSFTAPTSTGGSPITGYTGTCTAAGKTPGTGTGTSSPVLVSGLASGTTYSCTLTATNSAGTSAASNALTVTTLTATCTYSLSPTSQALGAVSANGSIAVTAAAGCAWTAASNATWISITSGSSGSGNGTVIYAVAANSTGSSRTGTLTIAGNTFTVTQGTSALSTIRNALFINASTSDNKTSVLRLINTSNQSGAITATAYNEAGSTVGTSNVVIGTPAARQMLTFTSAQLEAAIGYTPSSSTAKYRIVFAGNLSSFEVINFIKDVASGNLTLGQAQVDNRAASSATTSTRNALFVNASTSTNKTTVLRLINLSSSNGSITATAYDEAGNPIGVSNANIGILAAQQMLSLTSAQLEAAIGFTPALTTAKYRIVFSASLNSFEVLNFIKDVATGSLTLGQEQID